MLNEINVGEKGGKMLRYYSLTKGSRLARPWSLRRYPHIA